MDSFFARDIQRLFGFRDMNRFNALLEFMLRQSGGQFEVTRAASALGITRPTVARHLHALEITPAVTVVHLIRSMAAATTRLLDNPRFMPSTPAS
ncbi:MAG: hypothetical protein NTW21_29915 [Verrucomicrobia bacterium]|nr:hypothetical protein [Verrucomicrobiota bacterium]